jgi:putative acetyltransferase
MTEEAAYPLRPFLPADTLELRELFAASIEELTQEDYTEDQRAAWASAAEDAVAFAKRLGSMTTLVVQANGAYLGFASLKENAVIDMLYVHPHHAGEGVATALMDALETIAKARSTGAVTADVSDTAVMFFEARGYEQVHRNLIPRDDEWLANTYMKKALKLGDGKPKS